MARGPRLFICVCWLLFGCCSPGTAEDHYQSIDSAFVVRQPGSRNKHRLPAFCTSDKLGVRLACDPRWKIRITGREAVLRLSLEPLIELRVKQEAHQPSKGIQFGWAELRAMGRYQGWFDIENSQDCGRKIIRTKGYLAEDPRARAFDYYLVDWERIYSVQFTVSRTVAFEDYRPLFEEIIDSVEFVVENRDTVSFRAPNQRQCQTITRE